MKPITKVRVIVNPAAGTGASALPVIGAELNAARFAREAVASGVDAVAVYGGDGTLMEAAGAMIGSGIPLAILPGGSARAISSWAPPWDSRRTSSRARIAPRKTGSASSPSFSPPSTRGRGCETPSTV